MTRPFILYPFTLWLVAAGMICPARAATAPEPLVFVLKGGDTVNGVLARHAKQIRDYMADSGPWRDLSPYELVSELLRRNMLHVPHGVYAGNHVELNHEGTIDVVAGEGAAPQTFANEAQLRTLLDTMPTAVYDQLEAVEEQDVGLRMQPYTIGDNGHTLTIGDTTYTASSGILFEARKDHFHVVGDHAPLPFNVTVFPFQGLPFAFPANPYFRVSTKGVLELKLDADSGLAQLLASGQFYAHEDHYHVTRSYTFEAWRHIIEMAAADPPKVDANKKMLATSVQLYFLDDRVYISMTQFARDIANLEERITRAYKALQNDFTPTQVGFLLRHNASLEHDGKLLQWGDARLSVGDGLHFVVCPEHVHVVGESGSAIDFAFTPDNGSFRMPHNILVAQEGTNITRLPLDPNVATLLQNGALHPLNGAYRITEKFDADAFTDIAAAIMNTEADAQTRAVLRDKKDALLAAVAPMDSVSHLMAFTRTTKRRLQVLQREARNIMSVNQDK